MKLVKLKLDKERHLRFTLGAMIEFERITGKKMAELDENTGLEELLALLYVGLKWEDKELTLEKTGDIIALEDIASVNRAILRSFRGLK